MTQLDLKEQKAEVIQATVKKTFEPTTKEFNGKAVTSMGAYLIVGSQEYKTYFKEKDFAIAVEGSKLTGIRKLYKGSVYYEWHAEGDVNAQPQNLPQNDTSAKPWMEQGPFSETKTHYAQPQNDIQERIVKGQCFNNACTLLAAKGELNCTTVLSLSQELYDTMKPWLVS